jgi:hypothetical protein
MLLLGPERRHRTDFSFKSASGVHAAGEVQVGCAERDCGAEMEHKVRFFAEATAPRCPDTGERLAIDGSHVDHAGEYTFDAS